MVGMGTPPRPVPAAPNEIEIEAEVLGREPFSEHPRRWLVHVRVDTSVSVHGPNFAHPGEQYRAFATEPIPELSDGSRIWARAEYMGDERGGALHLREIRVLEGD
jgi:hypothetical protein